MISSAFMDASVTWAGAAGSAFYLGYLYRHGHRGMGAQAFLVFILAALLLVRGFSWITDSPSLERLTLAIAAWLPLGISLFVERTLRRHHPLWVKLWALLGCVAFFGMTVFVGSTTFERWLVPFAAFMALTLLINGTLLLTRPRSELGAAENRLASVLFLLAFLSSGLAVTDFRTTMDVGPVRLGAIAALLFVYAMLGSSLRSVGPLVWAARFLRLLALAVVLSGLIALANEPSLISWTSATLAILPITYAWMLLTGIVVNSRELTQESFTDEFMHWLMRARLGTSEAFIADLAHAPDAATHATLGRADLADYSMETLARFPSTRNGIASLPEARRVARLSNSDLVESAEQWVDLLERTQMTHGFVARGEPPAVFVMNLPTTSAGTVAETRLSVMQHISHEIDEGQRQ